MQCMYRSQVHAAEQRPMQAGCLLLMLSPEALHLHAPLQLQADSLPLMAGT